MADTGNQKIIGVSWFLTKTWLSTFQWNKLPKDVKQQYNVKGGYVEKEKTPKQPQGFAFGNFRAQVEKLFRDENPQLTDQQVMQTLIAQWKALPQKSRTKYGKGYKG